MKKIPIMVDQGQSPSRLDQYLAQKINNLSRSHAADLIREGFVLANGRKISKPSAKILPGMVLEISMPTRQNVDLIPQDIHLDIIYEDQNVLLVNKPAGMVVHPAHANWEGTLANAILFHLNELKDSQTKKAKKLATDDLRPGIVHRLDKNTSGIIAVAKNIATKAFLQKQFADRTVHKTYIALVHGQLKPKTGIIDAPIGRDPRDRKKMAISSKGKPASTAYEVMQYVDNYTLVKASPQTGRTHQIRVHFSSIGHPIVADPVYGNKHSFLQRHFLHAFSIRIKLPGSTETRIFEAPLSPDLGNFLQKLESGFE